LAATTHPGGGGAARSHHARSRGGVAKHADSREALAEVTLDVALKLGEVGAELVDAREHEGILLAVELGEEVIGAVVLNFLRWFGI